MMTSTREKFEDVALNLFADRGFDATTVGDIEEAAGFTRRGRSFYKHFTSKDEALAAAVDRYLASSAELQSAASSLLPLDDLRSELLLVCRAGLTQMANEARIIKLLEREGHRLPKVRRRVKTTFVDNGHTVLAGIIQRWNPGLVDSEATAAVLLGSMVNFRRTEWTFGSNALGVDEERFIAEWVEVALARCTVRAAQQ